jgi:acetoin utilization deacetylase AcuC-like enzyme
MAARARAHTARGGNRLGRAPGRRHRTDFRKRTVLTLSLHAKSNFPFRKQRSTIDVELEDGTRDAEYLSALDAALPRVFAFQPDIVFYQSGVDPLASDTLGRLALTHAGLKERDCRVMAAAHSHSVSIVITLGGGYSRPIELTAEAHANTFRAAGEIFSC